MCQLSLSLAKHSVCIVRYDDSDMMKISIIIVGWFLSVNVLSDHNVSAYFLAPTGYERSHTAPGSFGDYLRHLPLKKEGMKARYYDGRLKPRKNVYVAVIDLPIGTKNLHQCADAVIRLRAEYLWGQKKYKDIHFNFTSGFQIDYSKWMAGYRIRMRGNDASWVKKGDASNTKKDFWNYLEQVFMYAGTYSLSKELKSISTSELQIGDVFIQGGFPGHAMIVVDMAVHKLTKEKVFLLAQSYMPAQELQIVVNPGNQKLSPWYSAKISNQLITPEWKFTKKDLKRF